MNMKNQTAKSRKQAVADSLADLCALNAEALIGRSAGRSALNATVVKAVQSDVLLQYEGMDELSAGEEITCEWAGTWAIGLVTSASEDWAGIRLVAGLWPDNAPSRCA